MRFGHVCLSVCLRYMASTIHCVPVRREIACTRRESYVLERCRLQVQVQSCQGLLLLLHPSHLPPPPENGSVLLLPCSPNPCPPAHLLRICPLQNQSLTQLLQPPQNPQEN